jgi:hypothetical protein
VSLWILLYQIYLLFFCNSIVNNLINNRNLYPDWVSRFVDTVDALWRKNKKEGIINRLDNKRGKRKQYWGIVITVLTKPETYIYQ